MLRNMEAEVSGGDVRGGFSKRDQLRNRLRKRLRRSSERSVHYHVT